ncbi:MAG: FMN-binding protein [Clostridia bacterium]|nr:FMN-binding protein [Clostridia bacterium]
MKKSILIPIIGIALTAALLFGITAVTANIRAERTQAEHIAKMRTLLPGSTDFVRETYTGEDTNIVSVHRADNGYVIETKVYGYADDIIMMVGVNNDGDVTGLTVRQMAETYGLGANALIDYEFLAQFLNTSGDTEVGENVDAITGATVTSKAIARSINSAVGFVTGADVTTEATSWGG